MCWGRALSFALSLAFELQTTPIVGGHITPHPASGPDIMEINPVAFQGHSNKIIPKKLKSEPFNWLVILKGLSPGCYTELHLTLVPPTTFDMY